MYFRNKLELQKYLAQESVWLMKQGKWEACLRVNDAAQRCLCKPLIR